MGIFKKEAPKVSRFTNPEDIEINKVLKLAFDAMKEKGYNPYSQLMYYLYSEDKTHITSYNGAREALTKLDRDDIMTHILRAYFEGE